MDAAFYRTDSSTLHEAVKMLRMEIERVYKNRSWSGLFAVHWASLTSDALMLRSSKGASSALSSKRDHLGEQTWSTNLSAGIVLELWGLSKLFIDFFHKLVKFIEFNAPNFFHADAACAGAVLWRQYVVEKTLASCGSQFGDADNSYVSCETLARRPEVSHRFLLLKRYAVINWRAYSSNYSWLYHRLWIKIESKSHIEKLATGSLISFPFHFIFMCSSVLHALFLHTETFSFVWHTTVTDLSRTAFSYRDVSVL